MQYDVAEAQRDAAAFAGYLQTGQYGEINNHDFTGLVRHLGNASSAVGIVFCDAVSRNLQIMGATRLVVVVQHALADALGQEPASILLVWEPFYGMTHAPRREEEQRLRNHAARTHYWLVTPTGRIQYVGQLSYEQTHALTPETPPPPASWQAQIGGKE